MLERVPIQNGLKRSTILQIGPRMFGIVLERIIQSYTDEFKKTDLGVIFEMVTVFMLNFVIWQLTKVEINCLKYIVLYV